MFAGVDGAVIIDMGQGFVSWCDTLSSSPKSNNSTLILVFEFSSFRLFPFLLSGVFHVVNEKFSTNVSTRKSFNSPLPIAQFRKLKNKKKDSSSLR